MSIESGFLDNISFEDGDIDEKELFKSRVETISVNISVNFVDRKSFNEKKGQFIVQTSEETETKEEDGTKKSPAKFLLYLPEDLKVYEVPRFIQKVNEHTFGEEIPSESAIFQLQLYIIQTMVFLYENKDNYPENEYKRALKNYYQLYVEYLNENPDTSTLNSAKVTLEKLTKENEYIVELASEVENLKVNIGEEFFMKGKNYQVELNQNKNSIEYVNGKFGSEVENLMSISILENGVKTLGDYVTVFTKNDSDILFKRDDISKVKPYNNFAKENLDEVETTIREKLGIEKVKKELQELRKMGDKEKISEKEKEISNKIQKEINKFPWTTMGYDLRFIIENDFTQCVLKTTLSHIFLQELGIKHSALNMKNHIAIKLYMTNGEEYYLDAEFYDEIVRIDNVGNKKKTGVLTVVSDYYISDDASHGTVEGKTILQFVEGDIQKSILSSLSQNLASEYFEKKDFKSQLFELEKATITNPNSPFLYKTLFSALLGLGNYQKAKEAIDKAIKLDPYNLDYYLLKLEVCIDLGEVKEAEMILKEAEEISKKPYDILFAKGLVYLSTGKQREASLVFEEYINSPALEKKHGKFNLLFNVGSAYYGNGLYTKALTYFKKANEIVVGDKVFILNNIGATYMQKSEFEKAKYYFDKAIKEINESKSENIYVYNNIGSVYVQLGKYKEAQESFFQYREKEQKIKIPDNFEIKDFLKEENIKVAKNAYFYKNLGTFYYHMAINKKNINGDNLSKKEKKEYLTVAKELYETAKTLPLYLPSKKDLQEIDINLKEINNILGLD